MEIHPQPALSPMQSRGSVLRAPRRIFQEAWTANLFARMADVMAERQQWDHSEVGGPFA